MNSIFKCPECGAAVPDFIPVKCVNGHGICADDGIYQFTRDPAISEQPEGLMWLGYENVGINYEPGLAQGRGDGDFGMFGACSHALAGLLGSDAVVLDLGAGLGQASIPLAMTGVKTIAADISQSMLKVLCERARPYGILGSSLICARMNAYESKLSDSSLDAIIEVDMLHQVDRPDLVMREVKRVLKPGGVYAKYGCKGLPLSEEQSESNARSGRIKSDISDFYSKLIEESGYNTRPFSSWEEAGRAVDDNLKLSRTIDTGEISDWEGDVSFMLHKLKTRASGGAQLIPDDIHNDAWSRAERYAKDKYGEGYGKIKRYERIEGVLSIYTFNL